VPRATASHPARKHSKIRTLAKYVLLGFAVLMVSYPARSQRTRPNPDPCPNSSSNLNLNLPVLNVVQNATLSPPYSCRSATDFARGYETTALFLSGYSKDRNAPELLFNGACGSPDYFDVNTAGDEMSLIADLGSTPLAAVTTQNVFNLPSVAAFGDYTRFSEVAQVVQGHTYAAVINSGSVHGLFVFTVVKFVADLEVDLQFEVKDYQVNLGTFARSPGFDWNQ